MRNRYILCLIGSLQGFSEFALATTGRVSEAALLSTGKSIIESVRSREEEARLQLELQHIRTSESGSGLSGGVLGQRNIDRTAPPTLVEPPSRGLEDRRELPRISTPKWDESRSAEESIEKNFANRNHHDSGSKDAGDEISTDTFGGDTKRVSSSNSTSERSGFSTLLDDLFDELEVSDRINERSSPTAVSEEQIYEQPANTISSSVAEIKDPLSREAMASSPQKNDFRAEVLSPSVERMKDIRKDDFFGDKPKGLWGNGSRGDKGVRSFLTAERSGVGETLNAKPSLMRELVLTKLIGSPIRLVARALKTARIAVEKERAIRFRTFFALKNSEGQHADKKSDLVTAAGILTKDDVDGFALPSLNSISDAYDEVSAMPVFVRHPLTEDLMWTVFPVLLIAGWLLVSARSKREDEEMA